MARKVDPTDDDADPQADEIDLDLQEIARRAARRVLAEHGLVEQETAHPPRKSVPDIHVAFAAPRARPVASPKPKPGREVVTAETFASIPRGGAFEVPDGAVVTPLAEEEARRRGVRLVRRGDAPERIAVGSDHGGFALKKDVVAWVAELGFVAVDFGTRDENPVDYPDFARAVAEAVASGQCRLGIVVDGAGIGSAIAANKVPGVRAATCCDAEMARNAREHNFANVLALGGRTLAGGAAHDVVRTFLATATGEERHARRVAKIADIEARYARTPAPQAPR
jgi:ribose 5-phosphate isomerase B